MTRHTDMSTGCINTEFEALMEQARVAGPSASQTQTHGLTDSRMRTEIHHLNEMSIADLEMLIKQDKFALSPC